MRMNERVFHELQPVDMLLKPKNEWIQSPNNEKSTGAKMSSIRKNTYELTALPDVRAHHYNRMQGS
jgi:hypothetical protein